MFSREAFVKAWRVPSSASPLEPGEQVPERVVCRGNVRRLTAPGPPLGPDHVRPKPLPHPLAGCVGRGDKRRRESKPPRCRLGLEASAAATVPDEVAYLMERDEVTHLAADGWNADLEPSLTTAVSVSHADHDSPSTPVDAVDPVRGAEVVDVKIKGLELHRASVVVEREVAVTHATGAELSRVS